MAGMRVLVACEFSGRVRDAFLAMGHEAYSCDCMIANSHPNHIRADVTPLLKQEWDLVIAHPPCTYLSRVSAKHRAIDPVGRRIKMIEACEFFLACYWANAPRVCVENPVMFIEARERIGLEPTQTIQPYWFGDPTTKATCLYLRGLPPLVPTDMVKPILCGVPSKRDSTSKIGGRFSAQHRAVTRTCIAEAMAKQWGGRLVSDVKKLEKPS